MLLVGAPLASVIWPPTNVSKVQPTDNWGTAAPDALPQAHPLASLQLTVHEPDVDGAVACHLHWLAARPALTPQPSKLAEPGSPGAPVGALLQAVSPGLL